MLGHVSHFHFFFFGDSLKAKKEEIKVIMCVKDGFLNVIDTHRHRLYRVFSQIDQKACVLYEVIGSLVILVT